jgi:hypothetical protein
MLIIFYSFRCSSTCWNRHLFVLGGITRCSSHATLRSLLSCPTLWELSGLVVPLIASFFSGSFTQVGLCFHSNKHSFGYRMNTSLLMCGSRGKCLVTSSSHHTSILLIISSFSYNTTYSSWFATSYNDPPFTMLVWSYHWQSSYPFILVSLCEWMYNNPWHTSGYYYNYCFK